MLYIYRYVIILTYIYILDILYGCESKCKVWIMLRAHMCSRPTIQTPDPDPFRGNDPDVMIQTEMMNNSIDVRTPCWMVKKQFHVFSGTLSSRKAKDLFFIWMFRLQT